VGAYRRMVKPVTTFLIPHDLQYEHGY
jgi:hypothetical protein